MDNELSLCPHCKLIRRVFTSSSAQGRIERIYNSKGEFVDENLDKIWGEFPSVLRCPVCKKVRNDVILEVDPRHGFGKVVKRERNEL